MTEERAEALLLAISAEVLPDKWFVEPVWFDGPQIDHTGLTAQVQCDYRYRRARLCCALGVPDREVATSIMHELLHVTNAEIEAVVMSLADKLPEPAQSLARDRYMDAEERQVLGREKAYSKRIKRWLKEAKQ